MQAISFMADPVRNWAKNNADDVNPVLAPRLSPMSDNGNLRGGQSLIIRRP
jgi:hypothetical protein